MLKCLLSKSCVTTQTVVTSLAWFYLPCLALPPLHCLVNKVFTLTGSQTKEIPFHSASTGECKRVLSAFSSISTWDPFAFTPLKCNTNTWYAIFQQSRKWCCWFFSNARYTILFTSQYFMNYWIIIHMIHSFVTWEVQSDWLFVCDEKTT